MAALPEEFFMVFQEKRLRTFKDWPFKTDCLCTAEKMAEAGFYFCGGNNEPDLVRCFMCGKEMEGWEPEDDPWSEHESHTSDCKYLQLAEKSKGLPDNVMTIEDLFNVELQRQLSFASAKFNKLLDQFKAQSHATLQSMKELK